MTGPAFRDHREPAAGGLFVAIAGERVDGHDFAAAAVASGAAGVLGARATPAPTVVVDDVVVALALLARHVVDTVRPTVLALTGSQGKTGTKDYLGHVLASVGPTVATAGNLNNEIGVPLTALRCTAGTEYLVVEMGARGIGHIGELCRIAPPDVAAVLNVGTAHLGEFGSREAIARAKGEIVEALGPDGTAVLNADDPLVAAMRDRTAAHVLTFGALGTGERAPAVGWRDVVLDDLGRPSFALGHGTESHAVTLTQSGAHQVANATAAAALALAAGVDLRTCARALSEAVPASRWRMELHERPDGVWWSTTPTTPTPPRWRRPSTPWWRSAPAAAPARSRCSARCSSSGRRTRRSTRASGGTPPSAAWTSCSPSVSPRPGSRPARAPYPAGPAPPSPRWVVTRPWSGCERMSPPAAKPVDLQRPVRGSCSSRRRAERRWSPWPKA